MKKTDFAAYAEEVSHVAASQGARAFESAIAMCYAEGVEPIAAGKMIATALNNYSGPPAYDCLARAIAAYTVSK